MKARIEAARETWTGCGMIVGPLMAVGGIALALVASMGSVFRSTYTRNPNTGAIGDAGPTVLIGLGVLIALGGIAILGASVGYGWLHLHKQHKGPAKTYPRVRVVSRFGFSPRGEILTQDWQLDEPGVKRFVQLDLGPQHGILEFEAPASVWDAAGEGMVGDATVQGKWLGSFVPAFGSSIGNQDDRTVTRLTDGG